MTSRKIRNVNHLASRCGAKEIRSCNTVLALGILEINNSLFPMPVVCDEAVSYLPVVIGGWLYVLTGCGALCTTV